VKQEIKAKETLNEF